MKNLKEISYLQNNTDFRINKEILKRVELLFTKYGVSKSQIEPKFILQDDQLYELLSNNSTLISVTRPLLRRAFNNFTNKTNLLILTDNQGYIVDLVSSPEILRSCFNNGITLGSCMSYLSYGTNAISMSMYENRLIVLLGEEHYCNALKFLNCVAVPIRIDNQIIGFLDVSSLDYNETLQLAGLTSVLGELLEIHLKQALPKYYPNTQPCDSHIMNENKNYLINKKVDFYGKIMVYSSLSLTIREIEILYQLYLDKSHQKILNELCISKHTFKTHLKNIYQKLEVHTLDECMSKINSMLNGRFILDIPLD